MKQIFKLFTILILISSCNSQKTYFENGTIKDKGTTIDNKKQGKWKYFYENGNIKIDAEYLDDIPNGEWTFYHKNGNIKEIGFYAKENWTSFMERMRKSGSKNPEEHYLNKNGIWKVYFENKNLKEIGKYNEKGLPIGEWQEYYENNILKDFRIYKKNGIGTKPIVIKYYYPSGKLRIEDDSFTTGEWKQYYENGVLKTAGNNKDGIPNGKWRKYYKNGQLSQEMFRENNKIMEIYSCYDKNGNELDKGTIQNGNGTVKMYNENGILEKTIEFKNGIAIE